MRASSGVRRVRVRRGAGGGVRGGWAPWRGRAAARSCSGGGGRSAVAGAPSAGAAPSGTRGPSSRGASGLVVRRGCSSSGHGGSSAGPEAPRSGGTSSDAVRSASSCERASRAAAGRPPGRRPGAPAPSRAAARRRARAVSSSGSGQAWSAAASWSAGFSSSSSGSSAQASISPWPGRAVVVQRVQEGGGAAGLLLGRAPPVAGAQQQGAGAGEGDVAEAEFLGVLVVLHRLVERLQALGVPGVDVGQRGRVAAQRVRERPWPGRSTTRGPGCWGTAGDQAGDGDDVPLQALGLVGGEHLDGVLAAGQGVVQALLVLRGGAQEAEEGEQGRLAVARRRSAAATSRKLRRGSRGGGPPGRAGTRRARPPGR